MANDTINLFKYFGWKGGTIHQIVLETGCDSHSLIYKDYVILPDFEGHVDYQEGLNSFKYKLNTRMINASVYQGDINFWLGVRDANSTKT